MAKHIYKGLTPPTFPPRQVGHHYVDTVARQTYISVGTAVPADWILVAANAGGEKAGRVLATSFSGSPQKATVTFGSATSTPYAINISGVDTRVWTIESVTTAGFVINSNAALPLTGDVFWEVQQDGEFGSF